MKKHFNIVVLIAFVAINALQAQGPQRGQRQAPGKPAARQAARPAKPMSKKSDRELLQEQKTARSRSKSATVAVNKYVGLKNFANNNVCPIRNWTRQDRMDTAKWIKDAYFAILNGPKARYMQDEIERAIVSVVYNAFEISPYYLNLTQAQRNMLELSEAVNLIVADNANVEGKPLVSRLLDRMFNV